MGFRVIILLLIKRYTSAIHISEIEINKIYSFIKFTYSMFFINHSMIYFLRNIHQIYINWTKIIGKWPWSLDLYRDFCFWLIISHCCCRHSLSVASSNSGWSAIMLSLCLLQNTSKEPSDFLSLWEEPSSSLRRLELGFAAGLGAGEDFTCSDDCRFRFWILSLDLPFGDLTCLLSLPLSVLFFFFFSGVHTHLNFSTRSSTDIVIASSAWWMAISQAAWRFGYSL